MNKLVRQLLPFGSLVLVICILSSWKPDTFLTWENFGNVMRRSSVNGIIAIGMTSIIISAGIDLSVGSMLALCGMAGAFMMVKGCELMVFPAMTSGRIVVALAAAVFALLLVRVQMTKWKFSPFLAASLALFLVVIADMGMVRRTMGFYPFIISAIVGVGGAVIFGFLGQAILKGLKLPPFILGGAVFLFMVVIYLALITRGIALLTPYPMVFGTIIGIVAGIYCGLLNGALITKLKLQPFIVTLGTMSIFRGISLVMNSGQPYNVPLYKYLGEGKVGIIPISIIIFAGVVGVAFFCLRYTRLGRYTYAIGSNRQAAFHAGVNVDKYLIYIYMFTGLLVGVAAMIATSRTVSAQPTAGIALELDIIAAVVIGGASLAGGRGTITGTITGTLLISFLRNGCTHLGISTDWQYIVIGAVIILAVTVDQLARTKTKEIQG